MYRSLLLSVALIVLAGCAKQGMPPGGPEDKIPPQIIESTPLPETLNVPLDSEVEFIFSESIQAKNIEDAVFITPFAGESARLRLRGSHLKVSFDAPLEADRTYVITLGTAFADYRNNAMKASYTLAFSTGGQLDQGGITGRVYGLDKYTGVDIWAYALDKGADPLAQDPDYIVQCAEDGHYTFSHLAPGTYRLFCVQDRLGDRRYQPVEDMAGVTWRDAVLNGAERNTETGLHFRVTQEDTLAPSLVRLESLPHHWLCLHFDKAMRLPESPASGVRIHGSQGVLGVASQFFASGPANRLYIKTAVPSRDSLYTVDASALRDSLGLLVDTAYAKTRWTATAWVDTLAAELIRVTPRSRSRDIPLTPVLTVDFSEPVQQISDSLSVTDTLGTVADFQCHWVNPMRLVLKASARLKGQTVYRLNLGQGRIADESGLVLADTVLQWTTLNADTLTELAGAVIDSDTLAEGPFYITARQTGRNGRAITQKILGPGPYRFKDLLPGLYLLSCYRDEDGNGRYSMGHMQPYLAAERFMVSPDTVKLRARWPNEGNDLFLK